MKLDFYKRITDVKSYLPGPRSTTLSWIFNMLVHKGDSLQEDLPRPITQTLSNLIFVLTPLCRVLSGEAANIKF